MRVYVVVEDFLGGKTIPDIKGVYRDEATAEEVKSHYRYAFVKEKHLIQLPEEKMQTEVYVVMELLFGNVGRIVGVFKNKALAEEIVPGCEYDAIVVETQLI